jgi:hypothetical protein
MTGAPDVEAIHVANLLYGLCDRMREELRFPAHPAIRGTLTHSIITLDALAALVAAGRMDLDTADAYAEAGELTLRKIIGIRKLRDAVNHRPTTTRPDKGRGIVPPYVEDAAVQHDPGARPRPRRPDDT